MSTKTKISESKKIKSEFLFLFFLEVLTFAMVGLTLALILINLFA